MTNDPTPKRGPGRPKGSTSKRPPGRPKGIPNPNAGRPPKEAVARTETFDIRVTPATAKIVNARATRLGKSPADVITEAVQTAEAAGWPAITKETDDEPV